MSLLCGNGFDFPDAGQGLCCIGAAMRGASGCTCWKRVYDLKQAELDPVDVELLGLGVEPGTAERMCAGCAYRPGSPEKTGQDGYLGTAETLEEDARNGRFFCHKGMRRVVEWVHEPTGTRVAGHEADYSPPHAHGVPFKADGTCGELCAGWAARRRALQHES